MNKHTSTSAEDPQINPPGVAAIQPHTNAVVNGSSTISSTATFAEDDIRQFLTSQPFFRNTDGSEPVVARISLVSASEASTLLNGENVGRPPTALVYYVEVQGKLSMTGVSVPYSPGPYKPRTAGVGVMVLDAQTGNLLVTGFRNVEE